MSTRTSIPPILFGCLPSGEEVYAYTLSNSNGVSVRVLTFGGIIQSLWVPDRDGKIANVVLGYETLSEYLNQNAYVGALVGRYANRIREGKFTLENTTHAVSVNHGLHHLHGGHQGFDCKIWEAKVSSTDDQSMLTLFYRSPKGEEGFPGNLDVEVTYSLSNENVLSIQYRAKTDQTTVFNPTQHSYFNLSGQKEAPVFDHILQMNTQRYLKVNQDVLPTGETLSVSDSVFDFGLPKVLDSVLSPLATPLVTTGGLDHCFCNPSSKTIKAQLTHPTSGRELTVQTEAPGIQIYTGNHLSKPFVPFGAICLEDQLFPDSPNHPNFPSAVLSPGEIFSRETTWTFSWS